MRGKEGGFLVAFIEGRKKLKILKIE